MVRYGKTRLDRVRYGKIRLDTVRHALTGLDTVRHGYTGLDTVRHGKIRTIHVDWLGCWLVTLTYKVQRLPHKEKSLLSFCLFVVVFDF